MEIYSCQLNHMENPLGQRLVRCVFSWKVREALGKKQEAARIVLAGDREMRELLYDSGWDRDLDALGTELPIKLRARTRYFWTVSVRSDAGEEASSAVQFFESGKMEEPWTGQWISCDSEEKRLPIFEKAIQPREGLQEARLYICGLGLYEAFYNGERIGEEYFTPGSNDYDRWLQVQTYDLTESFRQAGTLSVLIGNGWYKGRFGFLAREEKGYYGEDFKLIAEIHLTYEGGRTEVIGTDESWIVRRSKISYSTIYDGEHRDDTLPEMPPERAVLTEAPRGALTDRMSTPVTIHERLKPVELIITPKGEKVLDLGQEVTGIFSLELDLPRGTKVHIQTGEILQEGCFYNENLRSAKSEYFFTSGGGKVSLIPHFTFFGFRYVKIENVENLKAEDFTALCLYSQIPERGAMKTGHALVNQLLSNVRWGLKDNFLDVPTDCPQRDERMGWTGDAQVFSPTACFLQDPWAFYAKYLYDCWQEQQDLEGKVPDVVPSVGVHSSAAVWGDMACIIPWNLYQFYGDKSILVDQYESMKAWVDYIRRVDGDDYSWREVFHYGDWLALDNMNGSAEAVMGATDEGFIASIYYAQSAEIVSKVAAILGREEDRENYKKLSEKQFQAVKDEYYSKSGRCCVKTQTALILTLKYGLSENVDLTIRQLRKLFSDSDHKLRTGFVGTPLLLNVLSDIGMEDLAFELLLNEDYPGWLHEIKLGATTVWERWNSLLDDGTVSGISMNSMNHYAYGSIVEWMFRHIAGFAVSEEDPGCRHLRISPSLNFELREQESVYDSAAGEYRSSWKITDPTHVELSVTVPFGAGAILTLPHQKDAEGPISLLPGRHDFSYETDVSIRPVFSVDSSVRNLFRIPGILDSLPLLTEIPLNYKEEPLRKAMDMLGRPLSEEMVEKINGILGAF